MTRRSFDFRTRLLAIVGVAAAAFIALGVAGALLGARVDAELVTIQDRYLPKLELEPTLEAQLAAIQHGLQDAVASGEPDDLAVAAAARSRFLVALESAGSALDPNAVAALRAALDDYYGAATDVSRRLLARETGEGVVEAAKAMQAKQARVAQLLRQVASLDRTELTQAFLHVARARRQSRDYQIFIGGVCLVVALALSLAISRSVLRSVGDLASGLQRFGTGEFSHPIPVTSTDELGRVATFANQMATNLDQLLRERARVEAALSMSNRELEAFSYSVAHDLRAPLRAINGFSHALLDDYGATLDADAKDYLRRIAAAAERMGKLIDALLALSRVSRTELRREHVNLSSVADAVARQLRISQPERSVDFEVGADVFADGDPVLLRAVLENLLGNSWKFTGARAGARIAFGVTTESEGPVYYVTDNGAGFDMAYAGKLFAPFQRLHNASDFAGTGIGLATVERIIHRHGGRIWAEGAVGVGATFHFTLPTQRALPSPIAHSMLPTQREGARI